MRRVKRVMSPGGLYKQLFISNNYRQAWHANIA